MTSESREPSTPSWQDAHDAAQDRGDDGYFDPATGLFAMTEGYLLRRGTCCESGCRHCPFGFEGPAT